MLTRLRAGATDERGITMIEVLVVIVLMGLVGSVVTTSLVRGMQASASTTSRFDALTDLQETSDRMTRELRAAAPLQVAESNRAVVVVFRNNFTQQMRYTYQYCPAEGELHVRTEGPFAAPTPPAKLAPQFATPPGLISCATTVPPLLDRVTNSSTQPVFQYFTRFVTVTDATPSTDALTTPLSAIQLAQARQIRVRFVRSLPARAGVAAQTPITVSTLVRFRNVR